jgi:hypothetical protein
MIMTASEMGKRSAANRRKKLRTKKAMSEYMSKIRRAKLDKRA